MKFKKPNFDPVPALGGLSIAALIAWGVSHWSRLPFWGAFALVAGSMLINGIIAEKEDNAPGGFNDPPPPGNPKKADPAASANSGAAHRSGTS